MKHCYLKESFDDETLLFKGVVFHKTMLFKGLLEALLFKGVVWPWNIVI